MIILFDSYFQFWFVFTRNVAPHLNSFFHFSRAGTFFGGIVLGLVLTLLVLAGLYAYRNYGSNQYTAV
jgi:hypothetical protein